MTVAEDSQPVIPGIPVADLLAGLQGLAGILMALLRRETTGRGDYLDVSMHESLVAGLSNILGPTLAENRQPIPHHERTTGGSAFYRIYRTRDGRHIVLGGQEPKFVQALLGALGRPDLAYLSDRGPGVHQQPLMDFLQATFAQRTLAEWDAWLSTLDVCYGVVNTLPEALSDAQLLARNMILTDERGRRHLGSPLRFGEEPGHLVLREPGLGEHNEQILGRLAAGASEN